MNPCANCDSPQVGNETFCSNCGKRVFSVVRAVPANAERRFFTWAAIGIALIVFAGFARTWFLRLAFDDPPLYALLRAHGVVMTGWFVFFGIQVALVATRQVRLHRRLGVLGVPLAAAVVIVGVAVALAFARHATAGDRPPRLRLLGLFFSNLFVFGVLVGAGIHFRRRGDLHKRLMLLASLSILPAAISRIPAAFIQAPGTRGILVTLGLTDVCVMACAASDAVRHRRLHPAFVWGGSLILAFYPSAVLLVRTPAWIWIATRLVP